MARRVFRLVSPIFMFFVLLVPYSYLNKHYIVKWFGCGCPKIDEAGNIINSFNANDFTALFWLGVTVLVGVLAFFASSVIKNRLWRVLYLLGIITLSLLLSYELCMMMQWK